MHKNAIKKVAACACLAWLMAIFHSNLRAQDSATTVNPPVPKELLLELAEPMLRGRAKLTVWGFDVYNASLWVTPAFKAAEFANHAFAIELAYLRDFKREAIASRSMAEMARQANFGNTQRTSWEPQMRELFPDVKAGDRITGVNLPGIGARFLINGKTGGEIRDPEFARFFFGIWLSSASSEPKMRLDLLAQTAP
jgi:Chalcone isomerase-like